MTLTRRRLVLALGGTAATAILAACGSAATPTPAPAAKPAEPAKPADKPAAAATTAPAAAATTAPAAAPTTAPAAATPAAAAPAAAGAAKKILYWGSFGGNLGKAEQETVTRFNAQSTGPQVDYQFQGSYEETAQKLSAALAARQGLPDVTLLSDVWWQKFWLSATIAPFDPYLQAQKVDRAD
ncbi:MAG TPA: extracellular solute-binding protein, partial [Chloroflexota bacterium]